MDPVGTPGDQLELIPALARARRVAAEATARTQSRDRAAPGVEPAAEAPVAQVLLDVPLAHLDRPFDYLVPASMHESAVVGSRVRVRFAGQDIEGFVLDRTEASDHPGRLAALRRSVSPEVVLTRDVARLCDAVAARYAGTRADVLRLAVPPRHATAERAASPPAPAGAPDPGPARAWWGRYGADGMIDAFVRGEAPRAVWTALPGERWATGLALAAGAALAAGRGSVLCVPDHRDLDRLDAALTAVLGPGRHVALSADLGPAARYRAFLAVARGAVRVVAGTRAAAFAPVDRLGLVAMWDDGDDLYAEPRSPYPHAREVLLLRAGSAGCAVLLGATARSVEAAVLVGTSWATDVAAPRDVVRDAAPRVSVTGSTERELEHDRAARTARLPSSAHVAIRHALRRGPVLVQTPRAGYVAALVCEACREPARCPACGGPLALSRPHAPPACRWCGSESPAWRCPQCGSGALRAPVIGHRRTAEELGRAFPRVPVRRSAGDGVLETVEDHPQIVIATPGAEPAADHGYAAVVLLDTWLVLARPDLRSGEEAARRWFNAATLARPASAHGRVVAVGESRHPALQALVRWDPAGFAEREATERSTAHLPPASRIAVLSGREADVAEVVAGLRLPPGAELLGPAPEQVVASLGPEGEQATDRVRMVVRVPRREGTSLSQALREAQGVRAARKQPAVRVQVDPYTLG